MVAHTADLDSILRRLERLEKQNRRLKAIGAALLILISTILFMGQTGPNRTVEAERFVLKDAQGIARGELGMDSVDRPTLTLRDATGWPMVTLAGGTQPFLGLTGDNSFVTLKPKVGERQVSLGVAPELFGLAIYDKKFRAGFAVVNGSPAATLFDEKGKERVAIDVTKFGPSLVLSDSDGTQRATLAVATDSGSNRTGETHKTSAASLVMFGKEGKVLWHAP